MLIDVLLGAFVVIGCRRGVCPIVPVNTNWNEKKWKENKKLPMGALKLCCSFDHLWFIHGHLCVYQDIFSWWYLPVSGTSKHEIILVQSSKWAAIHFKLIVWSNNITNGAKKTRCLISDR